MQSDALAQLIADSIGWDMKISDERKKYYHCKALVWHQGRKGSRYDFFAENEGLVWAVRILVKKTIKMPKGWHEKTFNEWEKEGSLWRKSKKYELQWFINSPAGMIIKTLTKVKDKRYLGSAGEQPKATTNK